MYEFDSGEVLGRSILDFSKDGVARDDLVKYFDYVIEEQPTPSPWLGVTRSKSGKMMHVEVAWDYVRDRKGQIVGFAAIDTDITERKQAQDALIGGLSNGLRS